MKGKSLAINIMTLAVLAIATYAMKFPPLVAAWAGVISFAITLVLQTPWFSSGELPVALSITQIVVLIAGIVMQVLTNIANQGLADPVAINDIVVGITLFLQVFFKDYGSGAAIKLK